jgi:hypothetical protein
VLLYEPASETAIDGLEDELTRAFELIRDALQAGDAVVVSLDERHLQGVGGVAGAALAHGLLGLARALAIEGRKLDWRITVLSSPIDIDSTERLAWIEHLAESSAASGAIVRLGGEHLGKAPV